MAAHTSGPWFRNIRPASKFNTVWADRNTHVARVVVMGLPESEIEGNIALIAAAPETLAALQLLQANPNDPRAHARARRAIASALGDLGA